jgi:hypothetical protein
MPLFVVETIQTFRHKYVIDCQNLEHAYDTVALEEAGEFSQMHLGEQIITGREISRAEFNQMNAALEQYGDGVHYQPESGSPWMGDKMIHVVDYSTPLVRELAAQIESLTSEAKSLPPHSAKGKELLLKILDLSLSLAKAAKK